ncbi:MAG: hypothetical protein J7501_02290 [Bdellovibrio sp.]|nr:hypothetical protein [Bdellovibrio sp.]
MQTFKKNLFTLLLSVNVLSLAACNLPSPKDREGKTSEAATFAVNSLKGTASSEKTGGAFALPESKVFNFSVCLKDTAYNKVITGHKFQVVETGTNVVSDAAGCVNWSETVKFNFLADSQYIQMERHIKGTGLHKGTRSVNLAINPWSYDDKLEAVVDLNTTKVTKLATEDETDIALQGLSADKTVQKRSLWVEDGRLFVSEQKLTTAGAILNFEMRGTPSVLLKKINGEGLLRPLIAGTFKARLSLIHSYNEGNKEIHRLIAKSEFLDTKVENGTLALKAPLALPVIPTRGQMVLALELTPVNGPAAMTSFEGIYVLNEYDQIKGSSFLKLASVVAQTKDFKIADYVNAELSQLSIDKNTGSVESETYQKPKIEVSQLEFRYIRVGAETTSTREVFYNIKACLKSGLDQKVTRAHTFKITKFRQNETEPAQVVSVKTDNNACVTWDESIQFQYFDCQRYLKGNVQIENMELGMNEKLAIIVNPWESWGAVARDMRYVDTSEKIVLDCKAENRPKTQIMMDYFNYATLSYNYQVDNLMNLVVTKKIQFKMDPRLLIYSSLANGRAEAQKLRDGIYLLKLAVVRNPDYDSNKTYVSSAEKFVTVISGQVNTDVTFQTRDLKALGSRNNLLVEMYPVDEKKVIADNNQIVLKDAKATLDSAIDTSTGLDTPTFVGPITLNMDEASRPLRLADLSTLNTYMLAGKGQNDSSAKNMIAKIIAQGQKEQAQSYNTLKAHSELRQFAKENNLDIVSLKTAKDKAPLAALYPATVANRAEKLVLNKSDLQGIITAGKITPETAQKLCAFWAQDYLTQLNKAKGGSLNKDSVLTLGHDCYVAVKKDPKKFFQMERHMLVKEVGGSRYVKGYNQGLSVGTSFSMSRAHSTYTTVSQSLAVKAGLGKKFLDLFNVGVDYSAQINWATSDGNSTSNSVSVNGSTTMTVQQSILKVRINKYEQCAIVRMNPALFIKGKKAWYNFTRQDYVDTLNANLSDAELTAAVSRGLLLCEGELRTKPVDVTENYYMIAQESNSSQMQDNGDDNNRNFFLALRSTNDYNRFVTAIRGNSVMPNSAKAEDDIQADATTNMIKLFDLGTPTIPGTFRN